MKDLSQTLKAWFLEEGFDLVGIACRDQSGAALAAASARYASWLDGGMGAAMEYLGRHAERKANPELLLPGWKSVVCGAVAYAHPGERAETAAATNAQVSLYTRKPDYHVTMGEKLERLRARLKREWNIEGYAFVDAQPVMDRFWAWQAGLGWIGKNTCLLNREQGSYVFLGGLFTTADLSADAPGSDQCGGCRKCIEACPTQALQPTGDSALGQSFLDSNRCIGYHTIENKGRIPAAIMAGMERWIAGCDICQTVCPYNGARAPGARTRRPPAQPVAEENSAFDRPLLELAAWNQAQFKGELGRHAMSRMKFQGFLRNLVVAIGNSSLSAADRKLALSMVRGHLSELSPEAQAIVGDALAWAETRTNGEKHG